MTNPFAWTDRTVCAALGRSSEGISHDRLPYGGVSTDTRTLAPGDLFIALRGPHFDGHAFVEEALRRGAGALVLNESACATVSDSIGVPLYPVPDTLIALGDLARFRRRSLGARVIGITGSSGKTTTKNLTEGALSRGVSTFATRGNFNNRIGVPKTLLAAPESAHVLVVEMGTNEPGEIATLTRIVEPNVGVVTTVSATHLEKLGSIEGVLDEKLDLLRGLDTEGISVVGDEPAMLPEAAKEVRPDVRVVGWTARADESLRPVDPEMTATGCWNFTWRGSEVRLRIPGRPAVQDALIALALADVIGVPTELAAEGVSSVLPGSMRGEVVEIGGVTLLVDCYNANPESTRAALETIREIPAAGRRIAVLGSMLELGPASDRLHRAVLEEACGGGVDELVLVGEFAEVSLPEPACSPKVTRWNSTDAVSDYLIPRVERGDVVLFKASRGVRLESAVDAVRTALGRES